MSVEFTLCGLVSLFLSIIEATSCAWTSPRAFKGWFVQFVLTDPGNDLVVSEQACVWANIILGRLKVEIYHRDYRSHKCLAVH